jgi:hypothetical protein
VQGLIEPMTHQSSFPPAVDAIMFFMEIYDFSRMEILPQVYSNVNAPENGKSINIHIEKFIMS